MTSSFYILSDCYYNHLKKNIVSVSAVENVFDG